MHINTAAENTLGVATLPMANYLSYYALIQVSGDEAAISSFAQLHLNGPCLSFETLRPTPQGLAEGFPSDVEDAFDALYGDWTRVASRHRFAEPARELGLPFPLLSRDDAIACHEKIDPFGKEALAQARVRRRNTEVHGAGDVSTWRKLNWYVDSDAARTIASIHSNQITASFEIGCSVDETLIRLYSSAFPVLDFDFGSTLSTGKRPKCTRFHRGKKLPSKYQASKEELSQLIFSLRRGHAVSWLSKWVHPELVQRTISLNEIGDYFLKGTAVSVNFALSRLRAGKELRALQQQFPEISDDHADLLSTLQAAQDNQRSRPRSDA